MWKAVAEPYPGILLLQGRPVALCFRPVLAISDSSPFAVLVTFCREAAYAQLQRLTCTGGIGFRSRGAVTRHADWERMLEATACVGMNSRVLQSPLQRLPQRLLVPSLR